MAVDDSYTKALLHMDGADASTTFTDESGKTWTRYGDAQIDTAQYKFGGASGLFDGTGDYIDTPDSDDFNFGSGEFTIDLWIRRNGAAEGVRGIFGQCAAALSAATDSFDCYVQNDNKVYAYVSNGVSYYDVLSTTTITNDGNWHHVALVRATNTLKISIDGTFQVDTQDITGVTINNATNKVTIGRIGEYNDFYFNGWIDEVRFSKGIARWTSDFTPPTSAYGPTSSILIPTWFF
jgi:hypothetical protein